jgi:hypothetical protein
MIDFDRSTVNGGTTPAFKNAYGVMGRVFFRRRLLAQHGTTTPLTGQPWRPGWGHNPPPSPFRAHRQSVYVRSKNCQWDVPMFCELNGSRNAHGRRPFEISSAVPAFIFHSG